MKKIALVIIMTVTFISCRESNVEVEHHSESGHVEDNPVNDPETAPTTDSTQIGTPPANDPAQNSPTSTKAGTGTGSQGKSQLGSVPDSIKPLN